MNEFTYIRQRYEENIGLITLNRPEKHNAFDDQFISELKQALQQANHEETCQVIIINAEGSNFCAGADLNWMKRMAGFTREENEADALAFAHLLQLINHLSKPNIALVQGNIIGGGIGLIACCDVVIASTDAKFCFSEVKLGLTPTTIAPYIIRAIGYNATRRYFLTAEFFNALEAQKLGLLHHVVNQNELLTTGKNLAKLISQNGPQALYQVKQLLNNLYSINETVISQTAALLATIRSSKEAQDRIQVFLKNKL
ncbi:enoyl-CoA hydratase [Coxiella-like endosymbiont of Rhipicephalus sanguineus]|uniref:enoyl-CoA hydratase-related protein n=1 Tax=Coxiella-like endosymbiont of Rhipicephalus sanguineus TaxID=1955402 RepID=UPI002041CD85|nr:enoyl-CoA hydratase-related protein [Coxiella-like endosymbiont of Rhipicephalus sanguineus]MBT8506483.1 enoyl-CoA hydratase [Coxiella-like endosymbiont of Rhipicephalus sanguineus]